MRNRLEKRYVSERQRDASSVFQSVGFRQLDVADLMPKAHRFSLRLPSRVDKLTFLAYGTHIGSSLCASSSLRLVVSGSSQASKTATNITRRQRPSSKSQWKRSIRDLLKTSINLIECQNCSSFSSSGRKHPRKINHSAMLICCP